MVLENLEAIRLRAPGNFLVENRAAGTPPDVEKNTQAYRKAHLGFISSQIQEIR